MPVHHPPGWEQELDPSHRSPENSMPSGDSKVEMNGRADPTEKIYIALGKDVKENKNNLQWCLQSFRGAKIVILHIHHLAPMASGPFGGKLRVLEWEAATKTVNEYLAICARQKAEAEHLVTKSEDDVAKAMVELISQHEISKLVMGAAADRNHSKKMNVPTSKKAKYVRRHASPSCEITFLCNGNYICTREPFSDQNELPPSGAGSGSKGRPGPGLGKWFGRRSTSESDDGTSETSAEKHQPAESATGPSCQAEDRYPVTKCQSSESGSDTCEAVDHGSANSIASDDQEKVGPNLEIQKVWYLAWKIKQKEDHYKEIQEVNSRLKKAIVEARNLKRQVFQESERRQKAEQEAVDAQNSARTAEISLLKEQKQSKELETALLKEKNEFAKLGRKHQETLIELQQVWEEKSALNARVGDYQHKLREALEKLEKLQERVNEREDVTGGKPRMMPTTRGFGKFSRAELMEATNNFEPGSKIGEGSFGAVYKGRIHYKLAAVKLFNCDGGQDFLQEVEALSKLRHPHLVTLLEACLEPLALVYEYLHNGSLEDKIQCKDGATKPTWQTRTRIVVEICSALKFLHSKGVIHGDLKPGNILLDSNLSVKIGDFGISKLLPEQETTMSICVGSDSKGSFAYMDPEFMTTDELTPSSDVYSFGVIILQLITGRPPLWINKIVQKVVMTGNLRSIIDPDAGDWPLDQASQLVDIGLKCCHMSRSCRPELGAEAWKVLEPLKGPLSSSDPYGRSTSIETRPVPAYFICPINQEIMSDPHVAADGFTYELNALREWFDSGHDTSPITNLNLSHLNLTPNHALRSAIEEWLIQS